MHRLATTASMARVRGLALGRSTSADTPLASRAAGPVQPEEVPPEEVPPEVVPPEVVPAEAVAFEVVTPEEVVAGHDCESLAEACLRGVPGGAARSHRCRGQGAATGGQEA
jgi:hypothetical protein